MSDGPAYGAWALEIHEARKSFPLGRRQIKAVDGVNLQVRMGQVTGLIGPDGAGKTTLMRLIAGLLRPDSGAIRVLGIDAVADPLRVQASIGYMPQRFGLYEDLSVQENLDLYADLQGVPVSEREARYRRLLDMTGLQPFTARLAGRLSGGMKQKLGLACTLVHPPRLLLLDEPTVGVDPVSRRELWRIVYQLVEDEGMSVLLSTAYLDEAERCAEVALMHEGRMLGQDAPAAFSRGLAGRVHGVQRARGARRRLQAEVAAMPGVVDAVIDGDGVRVLFQEGLAPPMLQGAHWTDLEPRFEDAFVAMLRNGRMAPEQSVTMQTPELAAEGKSVIEVHGLSRRFGAFLAVDHIDFTVKRGEIFGLLGANGAGKSTTFRMLCGLLPASDGQLSVAGVNLRTAASKARARIGYMAQRFALYGVLTVRQNLSFFARSYGLRGERLQTRMDWATREFDLADWLDAEAGDLSLGYKQRLAMACALMHEPDILFLDEPTSGVDPLERRAFWGRINALAESGVTIMVTTHFMDEAEYCDRVVIMSQGRILAEGSPRAIRERASTPERPRPNMEEAFIHLIQQAEPHVQAV